MVKEKGFKIAVIFGVLIIIATASFMLIPLQIEGKSENPLKNSFNELQASESKMLDFIKQEKNELESKFASLKP